MLERCDETFVGRTACERAQQDEPVTLLDDPRALVLLAAQIFTETAISLGMLRCRGGGLVPEPNELRVRVLEARAGRAALVDAGEDVRVPALACGLGPQAPGLGDELEVSVFELGDRPPVLG